MKRRVFCFGLAALPIAPLAHAGEMSAHDFAFASIDGGTLGLNEFAGGLIMVVNTASMCGFTHQYDGLQALYDRYRDRGFVLIGVPSDDFGGQEYDTADEVKQFCEVNFNLDFPMADITPVKGRSAHPFYTWARDRLGPENAPRWNFHKYLIGRDGQAVAAFGTTTDPMASEVTEAIEGLLE